MFCNLHIFFPFFFYGSSSFWCKHTTETTLEEEKTEKERVDDFRVQADPGKLSFGLQDVSLV